MWELVKAIVVVTLSLATLLAFLGLLYWLTGFLPRRWQETWRAWVFLFPAALAMVVGLLIPAVRTLYLSLFAVRETRMTLVGTRLGRRVQLVGRGHGVTVLRS